MAESLGRAVLELDADAGPLQSALSLMDAQTQGLFSALGTKLSQVMGGNFKAGMVVAGAAVVAGVAVAGAALYNLGKTFDDAYDTIVTKTGATGKELESAGAEAASHAFHSQGQVAAARGFTARVQCAVSRSSRFSRRTSYGIRFRTEAR